jgi:hypothetical protein
MIGLALALSIAVSAQGPRSVYERVVRTPDLRNGYEDYLRAADVIQFSPVRTVIGWAPNMEEMKPVEDTTAEGLRAIAEHNRIRNLTLLQAYREVSEKLGKSLDLVRVGNSKDVYDPRADVGPETTFHEYPAFKQIARVARNDAYVKFANGNTAAGTEVLLTGTTFGQKLGGSNLISCLVGIAASAITLAELDAHLDGLSLPDCQRIIAVTDRLLTQPTPMRAGLKGELRYQLSALEIAFVDPKKLFGEAIDDESMQKLGQEIKAMTPAQRQATKKRTAEALTEIWQALDQRMEMPEREWEKADSEVESRSVYPEEPITTMFVSLLAPIYSQAMGASARQRTQLRLAGLHARVLAYRWENGSLPKTLADAVGEELCKDPMSGGVFQYELRPGGYRLYSKGSPGSGEIELRYKPPVGGTVRDPNEPP